MQNDAPFSGLQDLLAELRASATLQNFVKRADELRARLFKCAAVFFAFFAAVMVFAKPVFNYLKEPLVDALPPGQNSLHFTSPLEVFMCYMKVGFLIAAVAAAPFVFLQVWRFIAPAIPAPQRPYVAPFFTVGMALFAGGCAFCFYIMLPGALKILIDMSGDVATPLITVGDYFSLVVMMMLGFGAVFQLPLALIVLERLGFVKRETLAANRRGMIVGILIVAAVATPTPDPFSQFAMATPMYVMFEASLLVMSWLSSKETALAKR